MPPLYHRLDQDYCEEEISVENTMNTTMTATILEVNCCDLLVCEKCTCQQVLVHTEDACCFRCGECVCIHYNGIMTNSLPPQITADCIHRLPGHCCC